MAQKISRTDSGDHSSLFGLPFRWLMEKMNRLEDDHYQIRALYDFGISTVTSGLAWLFCRYVIETRSNFQLFVGPVILTGLIAMFGLYSRIREPKLFQKALYLFISLVLSCMCCLVLGANKTIVSLWFVLTVIPVLLPRMYTSIKGIAENSKYDAAINNRGPILVVGGAGFIGSHLVEQLLAKGAKVRVLDKLMYGRDSIDSFLNHPNYSLIEGDATDLSKLLRAMKGASAVVHLGGLVGDPACSVDEFFTTQANIIATRMLKDAALSLGIPRFVFASSCSVYGTAEHTVDENSPLNPVSLYARTKIDSEKELLQEENRNFTCTILRFATVYGHSKRPRFDLVANLFTAQALKDGKITVTGSNQWRPFLHARDIAKTIVAVIEAPKSKVKGEIFNVGSTEQNMTIGNLAKTIQKMVAPYTKLEIAIKDDLSDRRNYRVSFSKLWNTLPLESFTTMESGVQEIIDEYLKGTYSDYKSEVYSNLATTKKSFKEFQGSEQSIKLYRPISLENSKSIVNDGL